MVANTARYAPAVSGPVAWGSEPTIAPVRFWTSTTPMMQVMLSVDITRPEKCCGYRPSACDVVTMKNGATSEITQKTKALCQREA